MNPRKLNRHLNQSINLKAARGRDKRATPGLGLIKPTAAPPQPFSTGEPCFTLYLQEVGRVEPLDAERERTLAIKASRLDKRARQQLLKSTLPLVVKLAQSYAHSHLSLLDLVAEGNLGLLKALDSFDPVQHPSFSSFARHCIRRSIKAVAATRERAAA